MHVNVGEVCLLFLYVCVCELFNVSVFKALFAFRKILQIKIVPVQTQTAVSYTSDAADEL